jgi:polyhydroxybutyrate depolymerase
MGIGTRFLLVTLTGAALLLASGCTAASPIGNGVSQGSAAAVLSGGGSEAAGFAAPELLGFNLRPTWGAEAAPQHLRGSNGGNCASALSSGMTPGKTAIKTITSGGMKRTYRLHLPPQAATAGRMPLVLNFHGRSGTGIDQEITSGLVPISDREGFVLVSPDGTGTPMGWSAGATEPNNVDDVRFVSDILDSLSKELCIDSARVYATGFSNGAFMSSRLACELPDRIAAVAVVGGVDFPSTSCKSTIPVLAIHGTADDVVPIDGGIVRAWYYRGANISIDEWAASNGCRPLTSEVELEPDVTLDGYRDCVAPTLMVRVKGATHVWPGAPGNEPGTPGTKFSAGEMVWKFFSQRTVNSN